MERALRRVTDARGTRSYTTESPFSVEFVEGRIQIAFDCPDFASCVAPPHFVGYETDMGITFDESLGAAPLVFERIER